MGSILLILLALAGVLLLILLNRILVKTALNGEKRILFRVLALLGLIAVNLIIMYSFDGVLGKIIFLIPLILIGPSYPLLFKR